MTKKQLISENRNLKILLNQTKHLLEDRIKAHEKCVEIINNKDENEIKYRKELEERKVELRKDIDKYKRMGWECNLEDALIEFSEIEEQLNEEDVKWVHVQH